MPYLCRRGTPVVTGVARTCAHRTPTYLKVELVWKYDFHIRAFESLFIPVKSQVVPSESNVYRREVLWLGGVPVSTSQCHPLDIVQLLTYQLTDRLYFLGTFSPQVL